MKKFDNFCKALENLKKVQDYKNTDRKFRIIGYRKHNAKVKTYKKYSRIIYI